MTTKYKIKDMKRVKAEVKRAFSKSGQFYDLDINLDSGDADGFQLGQSGYMEVMDDIQGMVDTGYGTVEVMLSIGEKYPREEASAILEEAREIGIL